MSLPISEKSSTRMTSIKRSGFVRSRMLCTERRSTDQASLWKMMTTLIVGRLSGYFFSRHLQWWRIILKIMLFERGNLWLRFSQGQTNTISYISYTYSCEQNTDIQRRDTLINKYSAISLCRLKIKQRILWQSRGRRDL